MFAIEDTNDNAPQSEQPSYRVQVAEDALPGTPVLKIRATDADVSKNFSSVTFFVRSMRGMRYNNALGDKDPQEQIFSINRLSGMFV